MIFATERLYIRKLQLSDFRPFHEMQGNERVMQYTTGKAFSEEENRRDLEEVIRHYDQPGNTFWVWAVVRKEDANFVGTCALIVNEEKENELGYRLLEKYWGNGYGTEILAGLVDYALGELKMDSLVAYVNRENRASVRMLEKSILTFEREFYNDEEGCFDRVYRVIRK